jgi:hypothetical protein
LTVEGCHKTKQQQRGFSKFWGWMEINTSEETMNDFQNGEHIIRYIQKIPSICRYFYIFIKIIIFYLNI